MKIICDQYLMLTYVEKDINRLTQQGFEYEIKLFYTLNASLFCMSVFEFNWNTWRNTGFQWIEEIVGGSGGFG